MSCGKIGFVHIPLSCIIGDLPEERKKEQIIYLDLTLEFDLDRTIKNDLLAETIDYVQLVNICRKSAVEGRFRLLESLALKIANEMRRAFPKHKGELRIKKPIADSLESFYLVEWSWI